MSKTCSREGCERGCYGEFCLMHKPRKPVMPLQHWKRPQKIGKKAEEWAEIRRDWIANHPAPWQCYLCGRSLDLDTLTIDHLIPRSNFRNYAHRHDDENLRACCWACNYSKGSKHLVDHQYT